VESILKRDRLILLGVLIAVTILAWGYMVYEARVMYHTGVCCCAGMKMSGPDTAPWSTSTLLPLFLMWSEMMAAMMIPSAAPTLLMFAMVNRKRREQDRPFVPTAVFLSGYLVSWTAFSALAALAQWVLHAKALLSPMMVSASPIVGGVLLIGAGVFQWMPLKQSCLTQCQSPLTFLMTDWREGFGGAFQMGLKHGIYCTGCCGFLMAILFVAGVMNIWWIAAITAFVLIEKIMSRGLVVGRLAGVLLAAWGIWMILKI
jgi:predicted metal-binding membrane protein